MRKTKLSRLLVAIVSLVPIQTFLFAGVSRSEFPERPITVLVSFDPGSTVNLTSRGPVTGAQEYLGKPLIFENRGGGGDALPCRWLPLRNPIDTRYVLHPMFRSLTPLSCRKFLINHWRVLHPLLALQVHKI